jgi:hypothetical protein
MNAHRRIDLHALVKASLALSVAALPFGVALGATPTAADRELAALRARYAAVLARMQDLDQRAQEVDELIARAVTLDSMRARGVAEQAEQSAQAATPVVAAEQRSEREAQQGELPDLPRVSSDVGGVLTPKGKIMMEPSFGYSYSSVSRVSIEGFTILPALLVGVLDIVEADRHTYSTSFSARYGATPRFELELRGSYLERHDATRSREYLTGSVETELFNSKGSGPGDYELGMRYQFQRRKPTSPYIVGNLRFKAANGTDPFELATASTLSGDPQLSSVLPTGSGFRSVSPSLTFIYPTDPVAFFGGIGYVWTEADDKGITYDEDGNPVGFGVVDPGDATRLNFGLGLGLNDRSSLSISYQLDRFSKTFIETAPIQEIIGSDVTVGKLLVGYSLKTPSGLPLNLAVGIGTTGDASDTDLTFRMPFGLGK